MRMYFCDKETVAVYGVCLCNDLHCCPAEVDVCGTSPCQGWEVCTNTGPGSHKCSCMDGYEGANCSTLTEDCGLCDVPVTEYLCPLPFFLSLSPASGSTSALAVAVGSVVGGIIVIIIFFFNCDCCVDGTKKITCHEKWYRICTHTHTHTLLYFLAQNVLLKA